MQSKCVNGLTRSYTTHVREESSLQTREPLKKKNNQIIPSQVWAGLDPVRKPAVARTTEGCLRVSVRAQLKKRSPAHSKLLICPPPTNYWPGARVWLAFKNHFKSNQFCILSLNLLQFVSK